MFRRDLRGSDTWCWLRNVVLLVMAGVMLMATEVPAAKVSNSFVTVEGRGIGVAEGGDFWYDVDSAGSILVSARSGWLVNGGESVTLTPSSGSMRTVNATSRIGEDKEHVHFFPCKTNDVHNKDIVIGAQAKPSSLIAMYALPDTGTVVSVSASHEIVEKGRHYWSRKYLPCACGEPPPEPSFEDGYYDVEPDRYDWTATAAGRTFGTSTWTGMMTKGVGQTIDFHVTGRRDACGQCTCQAQTNATVDVYELSIERPDYLGLDMTDAMKGKYVTRTATAKIDPVPASATYKWTSCGRCKFIGGKDAASVTYGGNDKTGGSESYLAEPLTVFATAWNEEGKSASANCTTNFTVVKVDVVIGGVGEDDEETEGAYIPYVADTNGMISVEGTNKFVAVKFTCEPKNLPTNEMVKVVCSGAGELYLKLANMELLRVVSTNYFANEISRLNFVLHGHAPSGSYKDGTILIEHQTSGAKDLAKYTSVKVDVEVTDFPTKKLQGEDKEEMPGAFIPYAADWAYGETPSKDESIPFGTSAREKLVEVFVSYEPSDLPEDEDGGKILEFEAPPDSLYLPAESAGVDQRWIEFVSWWNTRPASWLLAFEGKKRLLLHGHEKSKSPRDHQIRVTHPKSGATDVAKYTVYHVDLDIDSDNDLAIEDEDGFEDAIEEREPGKIISYDQSGICPGQDYRVPLNLKAWGGETNAVVKLEAVSSAQHVAEIYKSEVGGTKLDLPAYFPADSIPKLYVDGVTNGTVSFTATLINPPKEIPATTTVRSIPGLELENDKVAALIIQPISFAPSGNAAVWSSIPNDVLDGDGAMIDSLISNQGYKVTWYRDPYGERDVDVGGCTANAYLNLDNNGLVTIISHGGTNEHLAVYFPRTNDGYDRAIRWIGDVGNSGGTVDGLTVKTGMTKVRFRYYYVSVMQKWFETNWKQGFDKRNSIVLWGSCISATLLNCCGGRWRSGYCDETDEAKCIQVYGPFLERMNGSIGQGTLRPAGRAYSNGRSSMGEESVRMEGNPWTTLCPAPVVGKPTFPSSSLAEGDVAFGCLVLDTFLKDKDNMLQVVSGEGVSAIAPLRQEGAAYPFGVEFHIEKGKGKVKVRSEARKVYIESATLDGEFSSGKTVDVDRVSPNGGVMEWEF